ncbi:alpha-L-arabinofuranosidase C-terminal domain-containing protein [Massilibacteroides sp.]|uniref:alpha-L-arabinofuranosidase C-terminal domain-containing protein n=1 Tax=Massilibacteroides sp. TaxID=2034766 RepID=UPI0026314F29|nr:alpha-L-arabinofuranosidase C-terminal domain-containing protein [Massilibacteroides sp.]MDD4514044.1 alpha-L-arabinofuranosidase C-terminal domain-containing protein [Massilibacteroides sp.]
MNIKKLLISSLFFCSICLSIYGQKTAKQTTIVTVVIPESSVRIDPMIYGQMLEDCNDKVIYGGLINEDGTENTKVNELLKPLDMPVMRWPGGTYVHEYDWKKGIGPMNERPVVDEFAWKGKETNLFGTDEFLKWCKKIGTEPYINFNMGNDPVYGGSLGDALSWIEYVNGSKETTFGKKRALNGHEDPYLVKYWGIGNENYGPWGRHTAETADVYSSRLYRWASAIRFQYPDLQLLGVGHTYHWNDTVLQKNGKLIDFLTKHFYMTAKMNNDKLLDPEYTLFSPVKIELHLQKNAELLEKYNKYFGRQGSPIRFSIDEWNCRHSVFNGEKYQFTRNDARRQFDIVTIAGMLNVFIRQSPYVGMANYIFPVNGHGLVRTIGTKDAYKTPNYFVFELYRKYMIGKKIDMDIRGPEITLPVNLLAVEGDISAELNKGDITVNFIDGSAVLTDKKDIHISLINRSHTQNQKTKIKVPDGYIPTIMWNIENKDINNRNTEDERENIVPQMINLSEKDLNSTLLIPPCGFALIIYKKIH